MHYLAIYSDYGHTKATNIARALRALGAAVKVNRVQNVWCLKVRISTDAEIELMKGLIPLATQRGLWLKLVENSVNEYSHTKSDKEKRQ